MLEVLRDHVSEAIAPFLFLGLFLLIVGLALYLTPRIARWLEKKEKTKPGYFDSMTESPGEKVSQGEKEDPCSK